MFFQGQLDFHLSSLLSIGNQLRSVEDGQFTQKLIDNLSVSSLSRLRVMVKAKLSTKVVFTFH
jgi:hypothetical protein